MRSLWGACGLLGCVLGAACGGEAADPTTADMGSGGNGNAHAGSGGSPGASLGGALPTAGASNGGSAHGGAAVGGSASGGASNGGAAPSGGAGGSLGILTPIGPQWKLLWRDDFNQFDSGHWQKASHTFPENASQFTPDNAVVEGGFLKLRLTNQQSGDRAYSGAEVATNQTFTFGRFEARIRFASGSGIVSSLFTYKDNADQGWNEIDIENLGYITDGVQYNLISSPPGGGALTYQPKVVKTGYPPTQEFHDYAIEWTPVDIRFYVDLRLVYRDVQTRIKDPSRLHMNIWAANYAKTTFAGKLDTSAIPAEAQYDWVAVYAYQP